MPFDESLSGPERIAADISELLSESPEDGIVQVSRKRVQLLVEQARRLQQQNAELEALAMKDELTRILNKRAFDVALKQKLAERHKYGYGPFSLVLMDIDHFKQVNDTHGHLGGNAVLRQLADVLKAITRQDAGDVLARWGGEEFVGIGLEANGSGILLAERLRSTTEKTTFRHEGKVIPTTVSVGVVTFLTPPAEERQRVAKIFTNDDWAAQHARDAKILTNRADMALYGAKKGGRNQVWKALDYTPPYSLASGQADEGAVEMHRVTEEELAEERKKKPPLRHGMHLVNTAVMP